MKIPKVKIPKEYSDSFLEDFNPENAELINDLLVVKRKQPLCATYADRITKRCKKKCPFNTFSNKGSLGCLEWLARILGDNPHFQISITNVWWHRKDEVVNRQLKTIRERAPNFITWA